MEDNATRVGVIKEVRKLVKLGKLEWNEPLIKNQNLIKKKTTK